MSDGKKPEPLPPFVEDGAQDAANAIIAMNEQCRRQNFAAVLTAMQGGDEVFAPTDNFPVTPVVTGPPYQYHEEVPIDR